MTQEYSGEGFTESERHLSRLCRRSFLSLWSYTSLFRDQGKQGKGKGDGKELCDLVVVFGSHVLLFSDKDCSFPDSGNVDTDWARWYKKAIAKSADQIFGAERWIIEHNERVFLDRTCQKVIPIPIPNDAIFHRIVVAHGASERCIKYFGNGSGSLIIKPSIVGNDHILPREQGGEPFTVGNIMPDKGYVHVFDDITLAILLETLDTISDFIWYLEKKEKLIASGKLYGCVGEEDLLSIYLTKLNESGEHDFCLSNDSNKVVVLEGLWKGFLNSPQRKAQIKENEISYAWDAMIEQFAKHAIQGTSEVVFPDAFTTHDTALRFLAKENRTRRRMLASALLGAINSTHPQQRVVRRILPSYKGDPTYVFLFLPVPTHLSYKEHREARLNHLQQCCYMTKYLMPSAQDIVGIATESGQDESRSEDVVYFDARDFSDDDYLEAKQLYDYFTENKLIGGRRVFHTTFKEYPDVTTSTMRKSQMRGSDRNIPCPCGSGKKFKKCCG